MIRKCAERRAYVVNELRQDSSLKHHTDDVVFSRKLRNEQTKVHCRGNKSLHLDKSLKTGSKIVSNILTFSSSVRLSNLKF